MDETPYKSRAQGAVDSERMQLLSILAHHWEELESYEYGGGTQKQKWDLWEMIGKEFNAHPCVTVKRSPLQVKTLFKNMKTKARKYKVKSDTSIECGIVVEADPVSETVLQLTNVQSKLVLNELLDSLKNLRYFIPNKDMQVSSNENREMTSNSYEGLDSEDWRMALDSEDVPDIKEEVIEAFDSPCIIREDESPISFPLNEEQNENSSDGHLSGPEPLHPDSGDPSNEHRFGDNSVASLSNEKVNIENTMPVTPSKSFGLSVKPHSSLVSDTHSRESESISDRTRLISSTILNNTLANGLMNLIDNSTDRKNSSIDNSDIKSRPKPNLSLRPPTASNNKTTSGKSCCCPDYHKQMLNLAYKEHEMNISLLNEKILVKREERRMHEEERRLCEQNFLLKQEKRRASKAEHQARMKLIELECEEAQTRIRSSERTNRWLLKNGTKEI